jgi:glycosyltransferase involved in cell wall biosynthesis
MALPLLDRGHDVTLISKKMPPYYPEYSMVTVTPHLEQYLAAIEVQAKRVDIFHCHNEPSWFVTAIKERCGVPVILDIHDSFSARITQDEQDKLKDGGVEVYRIIAEERNNFFLADGLVFPGAKFAEVVQKEFNLDQPSLILPSYVPKKWNQYGMKEHVGGLVYEGRVDLKKDVEKTALSRGFKYCEYQDLAGDCYKTGIDLHFYTVGKAEKFQEVYGGTAEFHDPLPQDNLMRALVRHDWGLVGNVSKTAEWDVAYPNKMFEYLAACVPVVAINAPECARFLCQNNVGICVSSMTELKRRWNEHWDLRKNIVKKRLSFTMDEHIHKLEDFYERVIDERNRQKN